MIIDQIVSNCFKLFQIDLFKYATNHNTVNCIAEGQIFVATDTKPFRGRGGPIDKRNPSHPLGVVLKYSQSNCWHAQRAN